MKLELTSVTRQIKNCVENLDDINFKTQKSLNQLNLNKNSSNDNYPNKNLKDNLKSKIKIDKNEKNISQNENKLDIDLKLLLKNKLKELNSKLNNNQQKLHNINDNLVMSPKEFNNGYNSSNNDSKKSSCEIKYSRKINLINNNIINCPNNQLKVNNLCPDRKYREFSKNNKYKDQLSRNSSNMSSNVNTSKYNYCHDIYLKDLNYMNK